MSLTAQADTQAVQWLLRLRKGKLDDIERRDFDIWRAAPAHAEAFARARALWGAVDDVAARPEILALRERILARVGRRRFYVSAAVAAGVALAVISGFIVTGNLRPAVDNVRAALFVPPAPEQGLFTTTVGQRSTVTLRDGSVLTLNTDSAAQVGYSAAERTITLTRGQAMFEVAKDEGRPFVVHAGDRRIVATGTAFDVRLAETAVEVTLVEGRVHVDPAVADDKAPRRAELKAGERLVAKVGADVSISSANIERVTSWTSGRLVFLDTRLADALLEANRYTNTPIALADASLADLRVNGVFRAGQPAEFARAVAQLYPVRVEYQPGGDIRLAKK